MLLAHVVVALQSVSHVWLFVTPWTVAHQASLSSTISQSLLKFKSIDLVIPYNRLILCCPLLSPSIFPSIRLGLFQWVGSSQWVAKILEFQLQHQFFQWIFRTDFFLGLTGLISLLSKGLSTVTFNTTVQKQILWCSSILQLDLEKAEETEINMPTSAGS